MPGRRSTAPILRSWDPHTRSTAMPFTIIGVAPAGFVGAKMTSWGMPDIWMPLTTEPIDVGENGAN